MQTKQRLFRDGKYLLTFGFLAVFMGNFGQSFFIGSYGASIQQALQLSASSYGLIYSVATVLAGTSLMVVGGFIDKLPLLRFTAIVALGLWCASLLFLFSNNVVVLLAAFFLVRLCGQGLLPHTGITTMARCFDLDRGKAISIAASGVPVGEILLPMMATALIASVGWQQSWLVLTAVIPLLFLPLSFALLRAAERKGYSTAPSVKEAQFVENPQGRAHVLKDGRFWRALPALIAAPFVVTGIFIHQSFFIAQKAWAMEVFAASFIVYGVVHWLASISAGLLVDRFSAARLLAFYNVPMAFALLAVAFLDGPVAAVLMLGLLGVSIGFSGPVGGALWAEVYGTARLGSIRSMISSFSVWSTSLSPILFGVLIDHGISSFQLSFALAIAVACACLLAVFSYQRTT